MAKIASPLSANRAMLPPAGSAENISRLSASMFHDLAMIYKAWIDAGRSNLMQGYASSMATAGFLYDAGFMNPTAYAQISLLSDLMDVTVIGESIFSTVFGNGAIGPTLRTALDSSGGGEDEEDDESSQATTAASTLALAGQIAAAVA